MKQTPVTKEWVSEKFMTKDEFSDFKNDLFNRLDNIVGQLETIRDEQTLAYGQHKALEEKVDNHEQRISVLESPQV